MRSVITVLLLSVWVSGVYAQNGSAKVNIQAQKAGTQNLNEGTEVKTALPVITEMPPQSAAKQESVKQTHFVINREGSVDLSAIKKDYMRSLMVTEMPRQTTRSPEIYNYPETQAKSTGAAKSASTIPALSLGQSFVANAFSFGTPNDNDMAVSDSGMVVSVINTNIFIRDTRNDSVYLPRSLGAFTNPINKNHQEFDPKVAYDPKSDRFVLVCLVGYVDTTSKIVIGFSKTNDPNGLWNLYMLPGNPLNNNLWTDYPMIALTENELFLTVNLLTNNSPWQTGFVETLIWQINKRDGYAGKSGMSTLLHSNIKLNNRPLRNLCPVKGGSKLHGPNMYFLSNRNFATQNDTVFLVNVTDTIGAPGNTLTIKPLTSNQPYYFPPYGIQPNLTQSLATNDARNLGAFYENNLIQYVHNTKNPSTNNVSVYYGVIKNPASSSPTVTGYILPNDNNLSIAYPNISYAGNSTSDNSAIISFDHSSSQVFPGCSAIQADGAGGFSPVLKIVDGLNFINILTSSEERWGDYTGSQTRYNKPGEVWMSGYYTYYYNSSFPKAHRAWVAQIRTDALNVGVNATAKNENSFSAFPNPAKDIVNLSISLASPEHLTIELFDINGRREALLLSDWARGKENVFSFSTRDLEKGIYMLKVSGNAGTRLNKKIVVE